MPTPPELRDIPKDYPDYKLTIEGHAMSAAPPSTISRWATAGPYAKDYLVQIGIPSTQLDVTSYGKDARSARTTTETCWQQNRRIHGSSAMAAQ